MSAYINPQNNNLVFELNCTNYKPSERYLELLKSIISLLKHQHSEFLNTEDNYALLNFIEDILPDEKQAQAMFKNSDEAATQAPQFMDKIELS